MIPDDLTPGAAYMEGVRAERELIRQIAVELEAAVPQAKVNGVVLSTVPFADVLTELEESGDLP